MKLSILASVLLAGASLSAAAASPKSIKVEVTNPSNFSRHYELVSLPADSLARVLKSAHCRVVDAHGQPQVSQVSHDGRLLFRAGTDAGMKATYYILPSDTVPVYAPVVDGRVHPERADDLAWENEFTAFRAYGPATQRRGERGYGYDLFVKHPSPKLMLETLYREQNSPANWARVDSLRKIDPKLGDEYYATFSYHVDHGLGMDCFAVGPTLGGGIAAPMVDGEINYPWCYETVEVLDNGPLRFSARLTFGPRAIGSDSAVVESRLITLDSGSHFNRTDVTYSGLTAPVTMVAGFPRRDDGPATLRASEGTVTYSDPTTGPDNGRIFLGLFLPTPATDAFEAQKHILASTTLQPSETYSYNWGFGWSRGDMPEFDYWNTHTAQARAASLTPLKVKLKAKR